jgi:hypothetical protein
MASKIHQMCALLDGAEIFAPNPLGRYHDAKAALHAVLGKSDPFIKLGRAKGALARYRVQVEMGIANEIVVRRPDTGKRFVLRERDAASVRIGRLSD